MSVKIIQTLLLSTIENVCLLDGVIFMTYREKPSMWSKFFYSNGEYKNLIKFNMNFSKLLFQRNTSLHYIQKHQKGSPKTNWVKDEFLNPGV